MSYRPIPRRPPRSITYAPYASVCDFCSGFIAGGSPIHVRLDRTWEHAECKGQQ